MGNYQARFGGGRMKKVPQLVAHNEPKQASISREPRQSPCALK